jgi:hypothetical protein
MDHCLELSSFNVAIAGRLIQHSAMRIMSIVGNLIAPGSAALRDHPNRASA